MLDTLENVKTRLGITTTADDSFLTQQITTLSDVIEAYCRRKFTETDWVQTFYPEDFANSTQKLTLFQYPVSAIAEVSIDSVDLDVAQLRLHKPTGMFQRKDYGSLFGEEVIISYTAGYADGEMPTPILEVLDSLVSERYNKKKSGVDLNFGSDVQQISIPGAISVISDYTLANNDRSSSYGVILGNYVNVLDDWRSERTIISSDRLEYVEEDT